MLTLIKHLLNTTVETKHIQTDSPEEFLCSFYMIERIKLQEIVKDETAKTTWGGQSEPNVSLPSENGKTLKTRVVPLVDGTHFLSTRHTETIIFERTNTLTAFVLSSPSRPLRID